MNTVNIEKTETGYSVNGKPVRVYGDFETFSAIGLNSSERSCWIMFWQSLKRYNNQNKNS